MCCANGIELCALVVEVIAVAAKGGGGAMGGTVPAKPGSGGKTLLRGAAAV